MYKVKFLFFILQIILYTNCQFSINDLLSEDLETKELEKTNQQRNSIEFCDISIDDLICLNNGQKLFVPNAKPNGLIAHYNFDQSEIIDFSGNQNHVKLSDHHNMMVGPQLLSSTSEGAGASLHVSVNNYLEIPHTNDYLSSNFSYTFWIYLLYNEAQCSFLKNVYEQQLLNSYDINYIKKYLEETLTGLKFCPILQKGFDDDLQNTFTRSPALFLNRITNQLKFVVSTNDIESNRGEFIISNARLNFEQWHHIALINSDRKLKLYVNGILDAINGTQGYTQVTDLSLFIGNPPWHQNECFLDFFIDDLRIYNTDLQEHQIQAEASPALNGIEPNFIQLGCINCNIQQVFDNCIDGYHLCTSIELQIGGRQVAKNMGWASWNDHIFAHSEYVKFLSDKQNFNLEKGLGLCCKN